MGEEENVRFIALTRKYPLCRYFLGVLTHTTAWDQHWKGDEAKKGFMMYIAWLPLA